MNNFRPQLKMFIDRKYHL